MSHRRRGDSDSDDGEGTPSRPRKKRRTNVGAAEKGLRHFSMRVCEKVQQKGRTSYNEVADELVAECIDRSISSEEQAYDEKNIRRRVYDAINVLMALNIISKERKLIYWQGGELGARHSQRVTPSVGGPGVGVTPEATGELRRRVERKGRLLDDLVRQRDVLRALRARNVRDDLSRQEDDDDKLFLPFIIVNTRKTASVECEISDDSTEVFFNFDNPFELLEDTEIQRRLAELQSHTVPPSTAPPVTAGCVSVGERTLS